MQKEIKCLKISKKQGEKTLVLANRLKIVDQELEIQRDKDFLYIPLITQLPKDSLGTLEKEEINFEIAACVFQERKKQKASLVELLGSDLPPNLLASLPRAIDIVGDIAIIEIPPELGTYKKIIGDAILKANRNIRTVLAKAGAVSGTYRLREFNFVAGEQRTATVHREFSCQYRVDVAKAYFSPRLSYEHQRVASLVEEGETVADLFSGVGPFAILIAKTRQNVKVYAIDANRYAVEYLKTNIRLNRVIGKVYPFLGDAKQVVNKKVSGVADRVIMNLPEKSIEFVDAACVALKLRGGIIHFYSFVNASNSLESMKHSFTEAVEKSGRRVQKVLSLRMVRETAPFEWQAVLDANIR